MSTSEHSTSIETKLKQLALELGGLVDETGRGSTQLEVTPETVDVLVTATVRLYYLVAGEDETYVPDPRSVSPTEALTLVTALLDAHDIGTFDLALWLNRTHAR